MVAAPELVKQIKAARRVSVPLVAIKTPDPAQTIRTVCGAVNGQSPKIAWDIAQGLRPLNDEAESIVAQIVAKSDPTVNNPINLFKLAKDLPQGVVLVCQMANRFLENPVVIQAVYNLRDEFKSDHRMLILLGSDFTLPPELEADTLLLDEPLPTREELEQIVRDTLEAADLEIDDEKFERSLEAVQGLAAFPAEQSVAMSLSKEEGVKVDELWQRKMAQIEQTPGLSVFYHNGERFEDLGGLHNIKGYLTRLMSGKRKPRVVVWLDEIEKSGIANTGDMSGTNSDQLGTLLTYTEDNECYMTALVGLPGTGKSAVAKASGLTFGTLVIRIDMGAMKGSLVGQSEQQLRQALKVLKSVSGGKGEQLWLVTSNSVEGLDGALKSRISDYFFFDLPDRDELDSIWKVWKAKYGLENDDSQVDDTGWVGRNIRQCCDKADRMGCTLAEASRYIIPVAMSNQQELEDLRRASDGRYLSASYEGVYRMEKKAKPQSKKGRKIAVGE